MTLITTTSGGSDTAFKKNYVFVSPPWYDYFGVYSEGFENNNFAAQWIVLNDEGNASKWQKTSAAAYTGSNCIMLNSYGEDNNVVDEVITPSFNLSTTTGMTLTFKYSAASTALAPADVNETLYVYYSINCGTWIQVPSAVTIGTALDVAGYSAGFFTPTSPTHWATKTINLSSTFQVSNVRFKFSYKTGNGPNNLYIDDININGTTGISDQNNYAFNLNVYPNPSKGDDVINVAYTLSTQENISITLVDITGREIEVVENQDQTPGNKVIAINKNELNLTAGVYLIKISNGLSYSTQKIVISN